MVNTCYLKCYIIICCCCRNHVLMVRYASNFIYLSCHISKHKFCRVSWSPNNIRQILTKSCCSLRVSICYLNV